MTIERVNSVRERAGKLRRQFLKYKDAEIVYSLTHRKLLEMADEAGAIYRIDGTVLINRDIFDEYLEKELTFDKKVAILASNRLCHEKALELLTESVTP